MKKIILLLFGILLNISCSIESSNQLNSTSTISMYKNLKNINEGKNLVFHYNMRTKNNNQNNPSKKSENSDQIIQVNLNKTKNSTSNNSHN